MDTIKLINEAGDWSLLLRGIGVLPPVRGCRRHPDPRRLPGGWEESLEIELKGPGCSDWLYALQNRLALLAAGLEQLSLQVTHPGSTEVFSAPLTSAELSLLGEGLPDRDRGFQGVRLLLQRADVWQGAARVLLQNSAQIGQEWLTVTNHSDAAHSNCFRVPAAAFGGTDASPLTLELDAASVIPRTICRLVLAGSNGGDPTDTVLEGENAAAGMHASVFQTIDSANAGDGKYQAIQWNTSGAAQLCSWMLSPAQISLLAGDGVQPVLCLFEAAPANLRWYWRLVSADGSVLLDETAPVPLRAGSWLQLLPPLNLPQSVTETASIRLEAWLLAEPLVTHSLSVDFIQLLPAGQFVLLQPIGGVTQDQTLTVNGEHKHYLVKTKAANVTDLSHPLCSLGLFSQPGIDFCGYVLWENTDGSPVNDKLSVRVQTSPRWRVL